MEPKVSMDDVTKCEPFCSTTRDDLEGNVSGAYTDPIFWDPAWKVNAMNQRYVQSLFVVGVGGWGVRCNSRAVPFLVTVMEVNLGDQEIVSHISASILAVVIVLSLDSTLGSLVAVISHSQWGQINSQPLGKPLTTHSLLWNQAEIS